VADGIEPIAMDRIVLETDAPFLAPTPYRGKRNEPAYVQEVVKKIAKVKDISVEETAKQLKKNAVNFWQI